MEGKNVVMLVYNYFENDSRVLKEAATLSQVGYTVSIFTLWKKGLDKVEKIDENTTVYRQEFLPFHKLVLGENIFEFLKKKIYKKIVPKKTPNSQVNQSIKRDWNKKSELNSFKFFLSSANKILTFKGFYTKVKSEVKRLGINPSVIHAHDLNTLPLGRKLAKKYKSQLIYDSHELYIHRNKPYKTPGWYQKIQFNIEKKHIKKCDAVITVSQSIVNYLEKHETDLIVLATHQQKGIDRWLHQAVAEPVARGAGQMTLFIPQGKKEFVSLKDGEMSLQRILIPVDQQPSPQAAIDAASGLVHLFNGHGTELTIVHAGSHNTLASYHYSKGHDWKWETLVSTGSVVEQILKIAEDRSPDLIVMATQGHHGFLDALRGSTTERVLREAPCPVLAVLAGK